MKSIFEFDDYKAFLASLEASKAIVRKGFRSRLAEEIGSHSAFLSQVLNGKAHFALEQGFRAAKFLGLGPEERQHFLWMIEYARAGTKELKQHFHEQLSQSREVHLHIQSRVASKTVSLETQAVYYGEWYYPAIHVLVTIPRFRTREKIAGALGLSEAVTRKAVKFLLASGLLEERKGELFPTQTQLHLSHDSPLAGRSHQGWRVAALQSLSQAPRNALHYSTVSSLSAADAEVLRRRFLQQIEDYVKLVAKSPEEALYCFNLDFFSLVRESF